MGDYLTFRRMVTPVMIQIIFWIGVAAILIGGIGGVAAFDGGAFLGLLGIIVGLLFWRIWCELMLIMFKIYERLGEIETNTRSG